MKPKIILCLVTLFICGTSALQATPPAWWSDSGNSTAFIDGNSTVNNYAPINLGQLKNVANKAKTYLDNKLTAIGGAGPDITALVNGFSTSGNTNYKLANLGQLKAVAKPFYDRLLGIGYDTKGNLITRGFPGGWAYKYPWDPNTPASTNYQLANIGQLKMVFSFDINSYLTQNTDGSGLADYLKAYYSGTTSGVTDTDGDGHSDVGDVFPLDPAFSAVPANTATNGTAPYITLVAPVNATLVSTSP